MTKICHMTSAHGVEDVRIFHKECVSLAEVGYEVYLIERGDSYYKQGVHIIGVGNLPLKRIARMFRGTRRVYKKALELDADIYHFHDPELLPYGYKLKKRGKKVIFDSHENTLDQIMEKAWIPNIIRKPLHYLYDKYQRRICCSLDLVITVSPHIVDYFKSFMDRVVMITNYPQYQKSLFNVQRDKNAICFAGGITPQWNHHNLLKAIAEIPEARYVLMGIPEEDYLNRLQQLTAWKQVEYRGKIPHEDVNQVLSSCGIGVSLLQHNYNTGMRRGTLGNTKIYEQMMAGLPVICTNSEVWMDMIKKYKCGITVEPDNVDEIESAIDYLIKNPNEAIEMGKNGVVAVKKVFNWGTQENKLLEEYRKLI